LVLENDERYAIDQVLQLAQTLGIPAVFDVLHHQIQAPEQSLSINEWIDRCRLTWKIADGRPKIHYSQQDLGLRPGAHSRTVRVKAFNEFYQALAGRDLDIMLEVKDKNLSALKCMHLLDLHLPVKELEEEWARYKYLVLEHSQAQYEALRSYLKDKKTATALGMYPLIEEALDWPADLGAQINAVQHVWGYFKKIASPQEKAGFARRLQKFQAGEMSLAALKNYLYKLTQKYQLSYLEDAYYFIY
jgi:UV DNA damage endonuclease